MRKVIASLLLLIACTTASELRGQWVATSFVQPAGNSFLSVGSYLFAAGYGRLWRTTDLGTTWLEWDNGIPGDVDVLDVIQYHNDLILSTDFARVYRSTDAGVTWYPCPNLGLHPQGVGQMIVMGDTIVAEAAGSFIVRTYDEGVHWETMPSLYDTVAACFHQDRGVLYAGTPRGVMRSYDTGVSWHNLTPWLRDTAVWAVETHGRYIFAGLQKGKIIRSTDSGVTWQHLNAFQSTYTCEALLFVGDTLFAGLVGGGGVILSTDLGTTWHNASEGLANVDVLKFYIWKGCLFEGGLGGIWRRPLSEFSGVKLSAVPLSAGLSISTSQDNNVHLEFQEENNSILQIEFFDVLGRRVASYSFRSVAGLNRASYPFAHVASGTYVCRISGNQTMSKRFSIIR
ncbi:MAG: T9SS type A sorting domain-containing protein [Candidatus Kapaibacterium sp.]